MELEKLARQLRLMLILTQNRRLTIDEVSAQIGISRRSIYRYVGAFRNMGFIVKKEGQIYRIDHESAFLQDLVKGLQFTEEEALTIARSINSIYDNSPEMRRLRDKMAHLYDIDALSRHGVNNLMAFNLCQVYRCIREERVALFKNYRDENNQSVNNYIVEPYIFMATTNEVRCFDLTSKTNRTFKLDHVESVEPFDLLWSNKNEHVPCYTDLFGCSGEQRTPVSLLLTREATAWLLRSYPDAQRELSLEEGGNYQLLETYVCGYEGVARFILGLYNDVKIVNAPELQNYVDNKLMQMVKSKEDKDAKMV